MKMAPIILLLLCMSGCTAFEPKNNKVQVDLAKFAYANCLMWYFEFKGYDTKDIRAISGGIVETSDISIETFQNIALSVKSYNPDIKTKNNIDINLLKCFHLEENEELKKYLE